jgi:hypothetical protein
MSSTMNLSARVTVCALEFRIKKYNNARSEETKHKYCLIIAWLFLARKLYC